MSFIQLGERGASRGGALGNSMNIVKEVVSYKESFKLCSPLRKGGWRQFLIDLCSDVESNKGIFSGGDGMSVWAGVRGLI